jgi:hypothetical protein
MRWRMLIVGAVLGLSALTPGVAQAGDPDAEDVRLIDKCDKENWDLTFPGLCQRDAGSISVDEWQSKMNPEDFGHDAWWINASGGREGTTTIDRGDWLHVTNEGGENHTFTIVQKYSTASGFTGGCIPPLSAPLGLSPFPGDCAKAIAETTVAPGGKLDIKGLAVGRYQAVCVFHPWMRQGIEVRR